MRTLIRPMLAVAGKLPADDTHYGVEFKWDGVRAITYVDQDEVSLVSRNDRDITNTYPELVALADLTDGRRMVLDGEIVALDAAGRPSFGVLQNRMHVRQPNPRLLASIPVRYYLFDVLELDSEPLLRSPYVERREILAELRLDGGPIATPTYYRDNAATVLAASNEHGLEGIVVKRLTSIYESGRRSAAWAKVKHAHMQEVVICGWKPGQGRRVGTVGSLLLGVYADQGLQFAGHVGTGFTQAVLDDLHRQLAPLARPDSPFADPVPREHARDAHWVHPRLVGEVEYTEWTSDHRLRHPSWRGLRPDKDPHDVIRER
jgi:bifunctional non-homologous end joining protein LigD